MFALVKAHTDFLSEAAKTISDDKFETLSNQHVQQLTKSLGEMVASSSLTDATDCLRLLKESCFKAEDQTTLSNVILGIGSAASSDTNPMRQALKPQEHLWFHRYLTAKDWDVLTNRAINFGIKIDRIVKRAFAIGLLSMQEATAKHLTAVLIVASGEPCDLPTSYHRSMEVKSCFKRMRQHRQDSAKPTLAKFPSEITEFLCSFPNAYPSGEPPIDSKLDEQTLRDFAMAMPARRTHSSMTSGTMPAMINPKGARMSKQGLDWLVPLAQALSSQGSDRAPLTLHCERQGNPG